MSLQYTYCKMRRIVNIVIGSVYQGEFGRFYLLIIQLCFAAGDVGISALVALCDLGQFVQYAYRGMCQILGWVIIRVVRSTFTSSSQGVPQNHRKTRVDPSFLCVFLAAPERYRLLLEQVRQDKFGGSSW
jgi:hypothetical protein